MTELEFIKVYGLLLEDQYAGSLNQTIKLYLLSGLMNDALPPRPLYNWRYLNLISPSVSWDNWVIRVTADDWLNDWVLILGRVGIIFFPTVSTQIHTQISIERRHRWLLAAPLGIKSSLE